MDKLFKALLSGTLALVLAISLGVGVVIAQDGTVMDQVESNEELGTFNELLNETRLPELLNQEGPFTVIAPTDEAFENSNIDPEQLKEDPKQLQTLVVAHLFRGTLGSEEVEPNTGATVKEGNIDGTNGVVHVVDDVIQPKQQPQGN